MKKVAHKFTLTEFLVAIALSLGIFSILALSLSSNIKISSKGEDRLKFINELLSIDKALKPIFNGARALKVNQNKQRKLIFDGQPHQLLLVYQHQLNDYAEGTLRFIHFYQNNKQLQARYYNRYDDYLSQQNALNSNLAENISQINFYYAVEKIPESLKVIWVESWQNKKRLPLAIRLKITFSNKKTEDFLWRLSYNSLYQRVGNFTEDLGQ